MNQIQQLQSMIDQSSSIVFFGGAGVSTESGIPDFRSVDGLYNQQYDYPPEEILSHRFFLNHTKEFYTFYRKKILLCDHPFMPQPNAAHYKLAQLEQAGKLRAVVTQNIDGLHQKAGSKHVLELHGSVERNYCMDCGRAYSADYIRRSTGIPRCSCGGIIKPDVVLYEESLDSDVISQSIAALQQADLLIVGGTSLNVYPAAGFLQYFRGNASVLINCGETQMDGSVDLLIRDKIGSVLNQIRC